jgi:AraC family transcriptional regulator
MTPRIETTNEKKVVGKRLSMSFTDYRISELWSSFMPKRKEITNNLNNDLISFVIYKPSHFTDFKPTNVFEKWATVEVTNFDNVPEEMEAYILPSGLCAVFHYTGLSSGSSTFYQYIFDDWLPKSAYLLDDRPHVEILGAKYKNNDPSSEEEVWIPIKVK